MVRNIVYILIALVSWVLYRYCQYLVVSFPGVEHLQNTNLPCLHYATGEGGVCNKYKNVRGISILVVGPWQESVVSRVMPCRIQYYFFLCDVVIVLIPGLLGFSITTLTIPGESGTVSSSPFILP